MATTPIAQPPAITAPARAGARLGGSPGGTPPSSPRQMLARQEDLRGRAIRLVILLASFGILAVGWRVTQIDLPKLFTGASAARHILLGLVTPDVITAETTRVEVTTPFRVGEGDTAPREVKLADGALLRIIPGTVRAGEEIRLQGSGFAPNATGQIRLTFPFGPDAKFTEVQTDGSGKFDEVRDWPAGVRFPDGEYAMQAQLDAPTGRLYPSETLTLSLSKMGETILLALMGTAFGFLISVPLSFLGARNLMQGTALGRVIYFVVRTVFSLGRSIEVMILAVIMAVVVGIGPFAGVMAIVLHSIGAMGKLYSEAIESIDPGPIEAITATGASRLQTVLYGVVPQVVPAFLSFTMYRWDINVRMSTVIGLVGGGGIGFLLIQYINLLRWSQAATALWLIAIVVMAMDYFSAWLRARLV